MQRARGEVFPRIPQSLAELTDILQDPAWTSLTTTLDEEDSIYLGSASAQDGSHSIVFISQRCLDYMRSVDIIFADGTFFVRPSVEGCYQVIFSSFILFLLFLGFEGSNLPPKMLLFLQVFTIVTVSGHTVSSSTKIKYIFKNALSQFFKK